MQEKQAEVLFKHLFNNVYRIFVEYTIKEILMKNPVLVDKFVMLVIHIKWRRGNIYMKYAKDSS